MNCKRALWANIALRWRFSELWKLKTTVHEVKCSANSCCWFARRGESSNHLDSLWLVTYGLIICCVLHLHPEWSTESVLIDMWSVSPCRRKEFREDKFIWKNSITWRSIDANTPCVWYCSCSDDVQNFHSSEAEGRPVGRWVSPREQVRYERGLGEANKVGSWKGRSPEVLLISRIQETLSVVMRRWNFHPMCGCEEWDATLVWRC